jgi:hypothetical protein
MQLLSASGVNGVPRTLPPSWSMSQATIGLVKALEKSTQCRRRDLAFLSYFVLYLTAKRQQRNSEGEVDVGD